METLAEFKRSLREEEMKNSAIRAIQNQTGKDCEINTYYCNSEFYHFEGRTLSELNENLKKEGLSPSRMKHIYRMIEVFIPDEYDTWGCLRFEGDTLEEAYSKAYDSIGESRRMRKSDEI